MQRRRVWLWVGLLAASAVMLVLARRTAAPGGIIDRRYALLAEIGLWWAAFAVALWCALRLPRRSVLLVVVGVAVLLRLAAVSEKAPLSDDLYRYAWDGVVQSAGIDPYRYPPDADELRDLRTAPGMDWLWPAEWEGEEPESLINRTGVRTIYPPVAEAWFWVEHQVVPLSAKDRGYEAAGLGLDLAVLAALLALLRSARRDPRWAAAYALAPLPSLESVQNAHVDTLAVLLALGAVALKRKPLAATAVLALAALVKVYPALLLPVLVRHRSPRLRAAVLPVAVFAGVALLSYLPHLVAVGVKIVGYLPGYLQEEKYDEGSRYLLLGLLGLSGPIATVVVAAALTAVVVWLWRSDLPLEQAGVRLLVAVFLLVTPVQPWYSLLLLALVVLTADWWALPVCVAGYPLFFATILDGNADLVGRTSYGVAAAVVVVALVRSRSRPQVPVAAG